MTDLAASPLGHATTYAEPYDPALLFPVERAPLRDGARLRRARCRFAASTCGPRTSCRGSIAAGKPQVAIATFAVPAESPRIVESKSVKLYLTALNQTRFAVGRRRRGDDRARPVRRRPARAVERDARRARRVRAPRRTASSRATASTRCRFASTRFAPEPDAARGRRPRSRKTLDDAALPLGVPGDGAARLRERADRAIAARRSIRAGLLRYLVSFRRHPGFHEHCVERIFADVWRALRAAGACRVYARFTRRGGVDINPFRTQRRRAVPANVPHRAAVAARQLPRRLAPARARPCRVR